MALSRQVTEGQEGERPNVDEVPSYLVKPTASGRATRSGSSDPACCFRHIVIQRPPDFVIRAGRNAPPSGQASFPVGLNGVRGFPWLTTGQKPAGHALPALRQDSHSTERAGNHVVACSNRGGWQAGRRVAGIDRVMGQVVPPPADALDYPSLAGFAMQVLVGLGDVRDLPGFPIVIDQLALARA